MITYILTAGISFVAGAIVGASAVVAWAWYESDKPDKRRKYAQNNGKKQEEKNGK